ncbi:MAG: IS630 family transposase ISMae27, partial [Cyanobacteria bacterium SW_9_47_5]
MHYNFCYIYGLVEPLGGGTFFYEFCHFNSDCLELYLEKFPQKYQNEIHIIQL